MKSKAVFLVILLALTLFPIACGISASGSSERNIGQTMSIDLGHGVSMEFVWCPAGSFKMGSLQTDPDRDHDEVPSTVRLSGYWIAKTAVSQRQWEAVMDYNPSYFRGANLPVECVSWVDCHRFLNRLNYIFWDRRRELGSFALPTEAQWEYAARAGTTTPYATGYNLSVADANYWDTDFETASDAVAAVIKEARENSVTNHRGIMNIARHHIPGETAPVGSSRPNNWGIFDMHGNVWEWCSDWYSSEYESLTERPTSDPKGPREGVRRVSRGGGWDAIMIHCRSAFRYRYQPELRFNTIGFRPICEPPKKK